MLTFPKLELLVLLGIILPRFPIFPSSSMRTFRRLQSLSLTHPQDTNLRLPETGVLRSPTNMCILLTPLSHPSCPQQASYLSKPHRYQRQASHLADVGACLLTEPSKRNVEFHDIVIPFRKALCALNISIGVNGSG
ncbi:uncharacterized protein SCHCODRAFT_02618241 [Schizophyllum commune H4-8]|uniref:uncharacterized protein n=1 Tax=Schizophyllum commune (strain H4-8 / FGSC 9210) TaxID=578458 RepID=UPI002161064C|nr:uncharacterized protein SCHCODRAFT_02618241 [Schizophyllum commune H4-8]KAI5894974.1 hypothetical protein SCHCODRAFT_02618241 [Schizophyllum commune H4-8]